MEKQTMWKKAKMVLIEQEYEKMLKNEKKNKKNKKQLESPASKITEMVK